jgi:type II restriction enzyme
MPKQYGDTILRLLKVSPFEIDTELQVGGRPPTLANSEFLTNKEQGDWAEQVTLAAINAHSSEYRAIRYGRDDSLSAGDPGFREFYESYQDELNAIGKKPDLLIYRRSDLPQSDDYDLDDADFVRQALAAIEVRSSSFLATKYASFMEERIRGAEEECLQIQRQLLNEPYAKILAQRRPHIYEMVQNATVGTFRELSFSRPSWSSSRELQDLTGLLRDLKDQMKVLQTRSYLSITPKLEDLALVNRWIQTFGVRHYYMQVFFDKAYVIPFMRILEIVSDSDNEGTVFSVERDSKNQGKTTIKVDVQVGKEILGRIDIPQHRSAMKELERGRLLFYVQFQGGKGYLDQTVFLSEIINA